MKCGGNDDEKEGSKPFTINVKGVDISSVDVVLDDIILEKDIILRFLWWTKEHYCSENVIFWLEAQIFKYLSTDNEIAAQLDVIIERYIRADVLNIDEPLLVKKLMKDKGIPDKSLLLPIQNAIWNLLKYESFVRFKSDVGKKLKSPVDKKLLQSIVQWNSMAIDLLDEFLEKVEETSHIEEFNPYTIPRDRYMEDKKMNQAPFEEIFYDKYLLLGFREYLYRQFAGEYLSCYLKIKHFYHLADESELREVSEAIFEEYFRPGAEKALAVEFTVVQKIQSSLENPKRNMFSGAMKFVEHRLKEDLYISFLSSEEYLETNRDSIDYAMAGKKGDTIRIYKDLLPIFRNN